MSGKKKRWEKRNGNSRLVACFQVPYSMSKYIRWNETVASMHAWVGSGMLLK